MSTDAEAITEKVINLSDNSSRLNPNASSSDSRIEAVSPPASAPAPAPTTVTYIPGTKSRPNSLIDTIASNNRF